MSETVTRTSVGTLMIVLNGWRFEYHGGGDEALTIALEAISSATSEVLRRGRITKFTRGCLEAADVVVTEPDRIRRKGQA